ncbi:MAG: uL30 family ribosomal protein [Candidatus Aenigmarchaeota archaeon]|nr:uL30 family ribosomal protein [Candidatus Aenigmarchaeota archaeon]
MTELYAVVRLKGSVKLNREIKDTLIMLNLKYVNNCNLLKKSKEIDGMLKKARSCITWGEISKETLEKLLLKRAKEVGEKNLDEKKAKDAAPKLLGGTKLKEVGVKVPIRLHPASKGLVSIRIPFPKGDVGYRGDKINELIERMI